MPTDVEHQSGEPCMEQFGESLEQERRHGYLFPFPGGSIAHQPTLVQDAMFGLNKLAGVKFNDARQLFHRPLNTLQQAACHNIAEVIAEAGEQPGITGIEALQDMMKAHPVYGEPSTLVPFDAQKLKILKSAGRPKPIEALLPPHVAPLMQRWKTHIELTSEEFSKKLHEDPQCCPKQPYWDPILKHDKATRSQLIADLWKVGIINFRTSIKSSIGLFFVKKKTPEFIRMVVDCRIGNAHHRQPPVTRLGGASCFSEIEMNSEVLQHRLGYCNQQVGWGAELDVSDCFYQFEMKQLSKWFGVNDPRTVAAWKQWGIEISEVYDEDLQQNIQVEPTTVLFPVIGAMPMGWTWALFFANETVASIARSSCISRPLECREKLPTPQLWEAETFTSVYVDNVSVFGAKRQDVKKRMEALSEAFRHHDIPVVWTHPEPVQTVETVGVVVDFRSKVVRNKTDRLWKTYLAGRELCRRTKVRADAVEVWTGHITAIFRLCPCLLSVFSVIYRFNSVCRGKRVHLWPAVRAEIMQATALIWMARAKLDGPFVNQVDMGDSSSTGYALLTRGFPATKIHEVASVKEKWRFIPLPEDFKSAMEFCAANDLPAAHTDGQHLKAFVRAGVGLDTEYGQWIQEALAEGSWLKTSPLLSQYRSKQKRRVDVEVPALVKPVPSDMVREGSYHLLWKRKWRNAVEHINIKEARVLLSSLKRSARTAAHCNTKKLSLSDNLAAVLAFEKGRSSSGAMNRLCKTSAAIQIALQIRWRIRHLETKRNLADAPSRGKWFRQPWSQGQDDDFSQSFSDGFCRASSRMSRREPKEILLSDLLPPPGLGCCSDDVVHNQGTCGSNRAVRRDVSSATDNQGHAVKTGAKASRSGKKVRVFWELFAGEGNLSKAMKQSGFRVAAPVDIQYGHGYDLTLQHVQQYVRDLILSGTIDYLHMGTPCTVFSRARRGIRNFRKARAAEKIGCELAFFSAELARICTLKGVVWSIENPQSSRLWELYPIQDLLSLPGVEVVDFPMCSYGQPYKKPTRIVTNCTALQRLHSVCVHHKHAEVLKGKCWSPSKGWVSRTKIAGAYPMSLCNKWAQNVLGSDELAEHDSKEPSSAALQQVRQFFEDWPRSTTGGQSASEKFPITKSIPKLLDSVVFGHHSRAEAERRRQRRRR